MMTDEIKELTEAIRRFGKAAGELAHVLAGCAADEINPHRHGTLSRLASALRDASHAIAVT
jgi:hypothetical protein